MLVNLCYLGPKILMRFQTRHLLPLSFSLFILGWTGLSFANSQVASATVVPITTAPTPAVAIPSNGAAVSQAQQNILQNNVVKPITTPAPTPPTPAPQNTPPIIPTAPAHLWNLQGVPIEDIIEEVSRETGKNFLVDAAVQGKVTVISSTPLSPDAVYQLFLSILQTLGYATVPSGNVIKIMPNDAAKQQGLPIVGLDDLGQGDQMVAAVVPIKNVSANDLVPILRPMMPNWSNISAYVPGNSLIMTSSASNISRMVQVIHNIDKASTKGIEVVGLHHANATKLVAVINSLQATTANAAASPTQVLLAADEDNNSILMNGSEEGRLRMRALITQLDTSGPRGSVGNTKVVYLHFANAKKLAPILSKIAGTVEQQKGAEDNSKAKALIAADPDNNALLITAPPTEMTSILQIIQKVDVRPAEVLVEAIIVQIDETLLNSFGVAWGSIGAITGGTLSGTSGSGAAIGSQSNSGTASNPLQNVMPYTGIIRSGNFRILASALQKANDDNLLSTPDLMVLDNEKAKISVGTQLSVQNGSYGSTGVSTSSGEVQPFNTFSQQEVGLELDVTPHVSENGVIVMELSLENDSLQNPTNPGTTPVINTSGITTNVLVNSGDILVLGGAIQNSTQDASAAMPWLSNIPVLGWLFKFSNNQNQKKNLMIFLRPVIVNNPDQGAKVTGSRYDYMRNQQLQWMYQRSQGTHNFPQTPNDALLPHWGPPPSLPKPFKNLPPNYYHNNAPQFTPPSNSFPQNAIPTALWEQQ